MLEVEPRCLNFRDVFLNQAYTTSLCLTNPLTAPVEFTLRPSSPRYTVTPNRVNLSGGQSIVVTVRLFLSHYPNFRQGVRGQDDTIHIKSAYFEQNVDVSFFLHSRDSGTSISRSRSASPLRPTAGSTSSVAAAGGVNSLAELQSQVYARDTRISQLESIISQLESKYPSLKEIVRNRVEQERLIFEEKSEKALDLLQRKDETIGYLQTRLSDSSSAIAKLRQQKALDASIRVATSVDTESFGALKDRIAGLEGRENELLTKIKEEEQARGDGQRKLERALLELDEARSTIAVLEERQIVGGSVVQSSQQELRGLRERTIDQAEQIEVLVNEIGRLRAESQNSEAVQLAQEEIARLKSETRQLRDRNENLKQENSSLQQTVGHLSTAVAAAANVATTESVATQPTPAESSPARSLRAGHVSWGGAPGDDAQLEHHVPGTPVPSHFHGRSVNDLSHALQERSAQVHLYQERAQIVESENDELRARQADSRLVESELRLKLRECATLLSDRETEIKVLNERVERLRREKEEFELKLADKDTLLRYAVDKSNATEAKVKERDSHTWWSYIWHELKRQNSEHNMLRENIVGDGNDIPANLASEDAVLKIAGLKANLSAQAIEIACLRQELLGRKLSNKTESASLKEQIELLQRETARLNTIIRTHRGDKEVRLTEMATTIRSLSARSDTHSQLASARQELEAEKVAAHHLRADIDGYRSLLEAEQIKCALLKKESNVLQGMLDASAVLRTVSDVPGVDPALLIESRSGLIFKLQSDVAKSKSSVAQAQGQINNLQRSVTLEKKRQSGRAVFQEKLSASKRTSPAAGANAAQLSEDDKVDAVNLSSAAAVVDLSMDESQLTSGAYSIVVDGECTPQKLLDSFEIAALVNRIQEQENCIADLRAEIIRLEESALRAESARLEDRDHYEDAYRIDAECSSQKQELLQLSLDEAKAELATLRQENNALEKAMCDLQTDSVISYPPVSSLAEWEIGEGAASSTLYDTDEVREEFDKTKNLLRERTTQLKIIMETLDALHMAGVKEKENQENIFSDNFPAKGGDLAMLASTPLPSVEGSWGVQALVKRVVELTTELTSQCATAALEERRANQLEAESKRNAREINKLRTLIRNGEDQQAKMQAQVAVMSERLKESERLRVDLSSNHRREFDELLASLREAETRVTTSQVTINELKHQTALAEKDGFQEWIEHILTDGVVEPPVLEETSSKTNDDFTVKSLVTSLLRDLMKQSGQHIHRTSKATGIASKSEQRFLQKVADLVVESNQRSAALAQGAHQAELRAQGAEKKCIVTTEKLKVALLHLQRYRKRSHALEKIIRTDARLEVNQNEKLKSFLRKALLDERRKLTETSSILLVERRDRKLSDIKKVFDSRKMLSMQHRIAELESRGSATLRGREEAAFMLESRIKSCEESMHRWFKVELPRLISGLPLTEDTLGVDLSANIEIDFIPGLGINMDARHSAAALGLDRTFALAQALCCSKASATVQDAKLLGALEKNSLLKSRVIELEGVLTRWKSDIDAAGTFASSTNYSGGLISHTDIQEQETALYAKSETETGLMDRIQHLTARLLEVEEENIVSSGRLEHATEKNVELKGLVDLFMKEEEILKQKVTKQITKIRSDLEFKHAAELKNIREVYEAEKKELTDELEKFMAAVDVARATVDSSIPPLPISERPTGAAQQYDDTADSDSQDDRAQGLPVSARPPISQASALMTVVDAADAVGGRIRTLLTQLSDNSQRARSGRHSWHGTEGDQNQLEKRDFMELQKEIESLQSALEMERVRSREARAEAFELEQLLNAQRAAFSERVEGRLHPASHSLVNDHHVNDHQTHQSSRLPSPPRSGQNSVATPIERSIFHNYESSSPHQVFDNDDSLWPSLGSLLDELQTCLHNLPLRYKNLATDSYLKTALAMVTRLKRALSQGAEGFNIATTLMDEPTTPPHVIGSPQFSDGGEVLTLRSLIEQVQKLESKFVSERIPERNITLLRDMRMRVAEIESSMNTNFDRQKDSWESERSALTQALQESAAMLESLRASQEVAMSGIRTRYEEALSEAQQALEQQTCAASDQIGRMDDLLRSIQGQNEALKEHLSTSEFELDNVRQRMTALQEEVNHLHSKAISERAPVVSVPPPPAPAPKSAILPLVVSAATSTDMVNSSLEELLKLQRLLERTGEDLEISNKKIRVLEEKHAKELGILRDQNSRLKREADAKTKASSSKAGSMDYAKLLARNRISSNDQTQELEEQLRKMEYRFRSKSAELDAIVRSIARAGNLSNLSEGTSFIYAETAEDDASSLPSTAEFSNIPPGIRSHVVEARLQTAESEIELLQNLLSNEKRETLQKTKLQKLASKEKATVGVTAGQAPVQSSPPRSRTPARVKEAKPNTPVRSPRSGKVEDGKRRVAETVPLAVFIDKERVLTEEIGALKLQVGESRALIQTLREDVTRKCRLVASLKAARQAESTAADHWRIEAQGNEESNKRLQRAIANKDLLIKDLKARLETYAEESERHRSGAQAAGPAADPSTAQSADMFSKIKAAEVERSRLRSRLNVLRDRLTEADAEVKTLKEENAKLTKISEKLDSLRNSLARKEAQLRSLKMQLEVQQSDAKESSLEYEKRIT